MVSYYSFGETTLTLINETAAEIQPLNASSGLFIEEIAFLTLYDAEWNWILGVNLSYYSEEIHNLKVIVKEIFKIKSKIDQVSVKYRINETNDILYELLSILDDIENSGFHLIISK